MNGPWQTPWFQLPAHIAWQRPNMFAIIVSLCALATLGFGSDATAFRKVREGIREFRAGAWDSAGQAFTEADVAKPDDLRIAFDRACVYAAAGDADKARELLQRVSLSRDATLAVRAHYNLGCLAASQARAVFGEKPSEAASEQRSQGLGMLTTAVGHYRDCLRLDDRHSAARHNLEVIRLWIKHMQSVWQERDRQQARQDMKLLEFLAMLETRQTELRSKTRLLDDQPQSPKRRQSISETRIAQQELADEIDPLKDKIQAELKPPQSQPAAGSQGVAAHPASNDQVAQAIELLSRLADESGEAMRTASEELAAGSLDRAVETQAQVLDNLNQIYMAVAPYTALLNRSLKSQQALVERSLDAQAAPPVATSSSDSSETSPSAAQSSKRPQSAPPTRAHTELSEMEFTELARRQARVADWIQMLTLKAQQEQPQIEARAKSLADAPSPAAPQPGTPDPQQMQQQLQALQDSINKAIQLGPQAQVAAEEAGQQLNEHRVDLALPKQEQALKLLKEISEPLPKQDDSQQQNDQQDKSDNQENGDQDNKDQQDSKDGQDQKQDGSQQQQPAPRELSRQQALSVLRRARERERKHRQAQKQLRRFLASPIHVDRDW